MIRNRLNKFGLNATIICHGIYEKIGTLIVCVYIIDVTEILNLISREHFPGKFLRSTIACDEDHIVAKFRLQYRIEVVDYRAYGFIIWLVIKRAIKQQDRFVFIQPQ